MTSPDTTVDAPSVNGQLGRLGGALETPAPAGSGSGRTGLDGFVDSTNRHATNVHDTGKSNVSNSLAGARGIVADDAQSASAFGKDAAGNSDSAGGKGNSGNARGGGGSGSSPLGAFKSNMPVPGMANGPLSALAGLAQPVQGAMSSAQSVPQQLLSPLTSMLGGGGGGLPGASGLGGGSLSPMGAVGSLGGDSGGSKDLKSRLDAFVSRTAGVVDYAWGGGHGPSPGPSQGISDGGGAADAHGDYAKRGVDCSGFYRWALAEATGNDVVGSSTSQSQYAGGSAVSSPRPGDAAFPPSAFSGGGGPHHVQLYIGDGMIAEAPQSGEKVRVRPVAPGTVFRRYLSEAA